MSRGLQYVTATINCNINGFVPSLCVAFLQVKHTCAPRAAPAAQPSLCFWMRRNTESHLVPPFLFHLHIRNIETLCLPLFLVTAAVCLVTAQEESALIPRALKGRHGCNPAQHRSRTKHQFCLHQGASLLCLIASFV